MLENAAVAFRLAWDNVSDVLLYLPETGEGPGYREARLKGSLAAVAGAYALDVVTSCQVLVMFCFSSFSGVTPSFLLMSATCFSLAARTWDRVWISSSTCIHTHTQLPLDSVHSPLKRPDLNTKTNSDSSQRWQRVHKFRQTRTRQATVESR